MSTYRTVGQFKQEFIPKLHGTSLRRLSGDFYDKLRQSSTVVMSNIDVLGTKRRYQIVNAIYSHVYNYTMPQDVDGKQRFVDLRPISPRKHDDNTGVVFEKDFDINKKINSMTVEDIGGLKTLRVSKDAGPVTALFTADSLDIGGIVTSSGDVEDLRVNYLDYVSGDASIEFDLSGATGSGDVIINLAAEVDISRLENLGALFGWINFTTDTLNSYTLQWGNDASNYWSATVTSPYDRSDFVAMAWTLQQFLWQDATKTGAPTAHNITYLKITLNYTSGTAVSDVKIDNIIASLGKVYELVYYSNAPFKDAVTGEYREVPESDDDIIMFESSAYNMLLLETLLVVAPELKGRDMVSDINDARVRLYGNGRLTNGIYLGNDEGMYGLYGRKNPSEAISAEQQYYEFPGLTGY